MFTEHNVFSLLQIFNARQVADSDILNLGNETASAKPQICNIPYNKGSSRDAPKMGIQNLLKCKQNTTIDCTCPTIYCFSVKKNTVVARI